MKMLLEKIQLIFFTFIGLAPITYKYIRHQKTNNPVAIKFTTSYISMIFNIILNIVIIILNGVYLPQVFKQFNDEMTKFTNLFSIILVICGNICMAIILFIICLRYKTIIKIANQLVDVDAALIHFRNIYILESGKIRLLSIFCINAVFCISLFICEFYANPSFFPVVILLMFHRIIFSYFLIQYAIILTIIEKRFKGINNAFLKLKKTDNELECRTYDTPKIPLDRMCIVEVIGLKRSYSFLYKLCTKIADYYSLGIIIILPYFTTAIITTIYEIILSFLQIEAHRKSVLRRITGILWFFIETFPILALSTCATTITMEMKKTSDIVQKILYYCSMSEEIKKELKHFLLELLHKDFQFTAYNVVSIDSTMLRTMFSAVVTYLIILIQFQVGEIEKAAKD